MRRERQCSSDRDAVDAERGTLIASPVSVCLGWNYFLVAFFTAFFTAFFAGAFLAAFFVAMCLFSLVIRH
jgi:hypothetical protein